ncbi:MAG: PqqD family protein [Candidatus Latescibacteria bacterium]|jgi:hypothetical protein|nr:PqqD family protein [Candidatus Latescibacterota bacterium]MBT4139533.1 PqqD family protein [Candidatus Latescibacterota bacterium]MBT5833161.1 PqqD family protein [Candidatus Latescibacterota bacterium]
MLSFKKQPKIGREAMFKSKPVRNDQLTWETNEEDEVTVTLERGDSWKVRVLSKLFWIPNQKTLVLDEIGSQVWNMCDGRTTVEAQIRKLSEIHKLNVKEAEISLLAYLKKLGQKGLVGFVVAKDDLPGKKRRGRASGKAWGQ